MQHSFDVDIAKNYGILEAILLNNIENEIEKNKANNIYFYDGLYWTFNSIKAFSELFPYVSQRQIMNALKHLKEEGLVQTGNYNKNKCNQTLWYTLSDNALSILQKLHNGDCKNCTMETAKIAQWRLQKLHNGYK